MSKIGVFDIFSETGHYKFLIFCMMVECNRGHHSSVVPYRKIPNVSPGLIEVFKHFLGGLYSGGLIFGGHFVLVGEYQDLKNHCFISLL